MQARGRRLMFWGGIAAVVAIGLVFAFLGTGQPPEFPVHPEFEYFDGMVEIDSYSRDCNYFQNLENALDMSHIGFVHGDNVAIFKGIGLGRALDAEESMWGVTYGFTRPDGQKRVQQFGMPNIFYLTALPTDPEIGWQESMFWWVPIDDTRHMQFSVHRVPAQGDVARRIHERRQARRSAITIGHQQLARDVLEGKVAIVQGVGYDRPSFSHFSSISFWHTGVPNGGHEYGWVGRTASALDPLRNCGVMATSRSTPWRSCINASSASMAASSRGTVWPVGSE